MTPALGYACLVALAVAFAFAAGWAYYGRMLKHAESLDAQTAEEE